MVFSSYIFLFIFLPSLILLYFIFPKKGRNTLLLLYSLVFYGWNKPSYLLILFLSIFVNWLGGFLIASYRKKSFQKIILFLSVVLNCLILGYFKYTDFIITNFNTLFHTEHPLKNIALPIGISFFTFQGLSYVVDVYRQNDLYQKNPFNVALYISLFPQLVAGPIVRYDSVAAQISERSENINKIVYGLERFTIGLCKKIILADTFGIIADYVFDEAKLDTGLAWVGMLAYTLQIFFDFSGYSDMAIGLGKIFGFDFCENFNYPYISTSITEFWRRWHMSLSSWFRDYVYIPLGGNRVGPYRQIFNMFVVWALTGLWHGAAWTFIVWGLYYFVLLFMEKYILKNVLTKIPVFIRYVVTFLLINIGWVLFRSNNLTAAVTYIKTLFSFSWDNNSVNDLCRYLINYKTFWIVGFIAMTPALKKLYIYCKTKTNNHILFQGLEYVFIFALLLLDILYIIASSYNAFIYFQF